MRRLAACLLLIPVACHPSLPGGSTLPPGVHAGEPQTPEEKEAAQRILANLQPGDRIEWLEWGPHDLDGSTHWHDPKGWKVIRVRTRFLRPEQPPVVGDGFVVVGAKRDRWYVDDINLFGRDWLERYRQDKQREAEAGRQ
jgi:hypothetical protein